MAGRQEVGGWEEGKSGTDGGTRSKKEEKRKEAGG
jgi:hypothetical protein